MVRTGRREATGLIYPDHLKYDQVSRLPYSALFERLRTFLTTPDTLLICTGFSFFDSHICAVLDEAMAANAHSAIFAFQYRVLDEEQTVISMARSRPNLSVYARDGAIINSIEGQWVSGATPNEEWQDIQQTFWKPSSDGHAGEFLLGDFAMLARFLALTQAHRLTSPAQDETEDTAGSKDSQVAAESPNA